MKRGPARLMVSLFLSDLVVTMTALLLARFLRQGAGYGRPLDPRSQWFTLPVFAFAAVVSAISLAASGAYDSQRLIRAYREVWHVSLGVVIEALVLSTALYFGERSTSRLLVLYFLALQWTLLVFARLAARTLWAALPSRRVRPRRVLIIGAGTLGQYVGERMTERAWMGFEPVGYLDDDSIQGALVGGIPVMGRIEDAVPIVRSQAVHDVVIALPLDAHRRMANVVAGLQELPVAIKVVPDLMPLTFARMKMETLGEMPLIGLSQPALTAPARAAKRALDIVASGVALVLTAPLFPIIALAIRRDAPGPVIFRQLRMGENERLFWMLKFRTMVVGAEAKEEEILSRWTSGEIPEIKPKDDPRITRVGHFLRKSSLDELPQLINVLRGDMSLVGPRPEQPALAKMYEPWQRKRFRVPQGMTGWWQIQHRGVHPIYLHAEDDLYYFRNYSLFLDIQILLRTLSAVLKGRGAR